MPYISYIGYKNKKRYIVTLAIYVTITSYVTKANIVIYAI